MSLTTVQPTLTTLHSSLMSLH
jgi:chromosome segregation ATPase